MSFNLNATLSNSIDNNPIQDDSLILSLHGLHVTIKSNSATLLTVLKHYFRHLSLGEETGLSDKKITLTAIQNKQITLDLPFEEWQREAGKTGRKEDVVDLKNQDTRIIYKIRTGMYFVQSQSQLYAFGPCEDNPNQIINFINNQYLNHLQQHDSALCHASALIHNGQALAIAGLSGGGKSTLMLHLLEACSCQFLSNDRIVVAKNSEHKTMAYGIPKLPRVNPGTLLNQASLTHILTKERQQELRAMPRDILWNLEEKYDVDIEDWLGSGHIKHSAPLNAFIILNWSHNAKDATQFKAVEIKERHDLLPAVMKSYGPFYQYPDGHFLENGQDTEIDDYLKQLDSISFYELRGEINFSTAVKLIQTQLLQN